MKREPYLNGEETLAREENAEVEAFIKGVVSHLVVAVIVVGGAISLLYLFGR